MGNVDDIWFYVDEIQRITVIERTSSWRNGNNSGKGRRCH